MTTFRSLLDAVLLWCHYPRCPFCLERTQHLEAHIHIEHCGDDLPKETHRG